MPYWTREQETKLKDMIDQGKSLDEIIQHFQRSPEAIRLKLKRSGLSIPLPLSPIKVTSVTTTPKLEPVKPAEHLIDYEGTMRLLLGAIKRLNEPNTSPEEVKKLRLLISASKAYALLLARYVDMTGEELKDKQPEPEESTTLSLEERMSKLKGILKNSASTQAHGGEKHEGNRAGAQA